MKVILGICGSIAAYKSLELIRLLKKQNIDVQVILTKSALNFVTPLSCQTLSNNETYIDQFVLTKGIKHLTLSTWGDLLVIAPATANIIGKAACGIGDDLLSTTLLSFPKPILFVPAMDQEMWDNKITQTNVKKLKDFGFHFVEPGYGVLASGKIGRGRFPSMSIVYKKILTILEKNSSLAGKKFLVTGGRTEENLDPIRVVTNRSSGLMGLELINAAFCREGKVRGIFGEVNVPLPSEIEVLRARTANEMLRYLVENIQWCDCLIMAAAVGDYRPKTKSVGKMHAAKLAIEFEKNKDLLRSISKKLVNKVVVGFSLEDKNQLKRAKEKIVSKGLNFIVLNSAQAIGSERVVAKILKRQGKLTALRRLSKWQLANRILDECMVELKKKK